MRMEAPESRSLPALLAPELRRALLRLSREERAKDLATRALRGLAGFASALKVKYQDIETETKYDKNDKNKAAVVMTDGKVTATAKIGGELQTQTMDIKKLEEPERTYDTVRINGVWLVDTKL